VECTSSFASFADVREAILYIRAQADSATHSGRSLSARAKIGKPKRRESFTVRRLPFGVQVAGIVPRTPDGSSNRDDPHTPSRCLETPNAELLPMSCAGERRTVNGI
jgi:hypothetical protein